MLVEDDAAISERVNASTSVRATRFVQLTSQPAVVAVVCAAAILPYVPTLFGYFAGDDFGLAQRFFQRPVLYVATLFTRPWSDGIFGGFPDELRPFLGLTYQIDGWVGGGSPVPFHLTNLALHALTAGLVFGIARYTLSLDASAAMVGAMLFAVLPVHAETVAWISGRVDSLYTVFYLLSFLTFALWRERRGPALYGASIVAFWCALFSKQNAITLPVLLLLYDAICLRRREARELARTHTPYVGLMVGYLLLRRIIFGQALRTYAISVKSLLDFARLQGVYLELILTNRVPMSLVYQIGIVAALVLAPVAVWALTSTRERRQLLFFGPIWWGVNVAPTVVAGYATTRHLYLPAAAYALSAGLAFQTIRRRAPGAPSWAAAGALILTYLVWLNPAIQAWQGATSMARTFQHELSAKLPEVEGHALVLLDPPISVRAPGVYPWVWIMPWAFPFALQPPFVPQELGERHHTVWTMPADCCPPEAWHSRTNSVLRAWVREAEAGPLVALTWNYSSEATDTVVVLPLPGVRRRIMSLIEIAQPDVAAQALRALIGSLRDEAAATPARRPG